MSKKVKGLRRQAKEKEPSTDAQTSARRRVLTWVGLSAALGVSVWILSSRDSLPAHTFSSDSAPNILLISVDTLRADHLGVYGAQVPTPTLDRLARDGVVFEKAVSHVPITLPSHSSLMTGTYPIAHSVRDNGSFRLADDKTTLAEIFKLSGYRTAAFVGSFALDSRFGLHQGFELYDDYYGDTGAFNDFGISERPAQAVLDPALAWLNEHSGERWFVFLHLFDPHAPYAPPAPFGAKHRLDPYAGEIAYVDDALGKFLAKLRESGRLENTVIVFTADHGESLGEHGERTHGMFAYDSTLHVPLFFTWPGVLPGGVRVSSRVRLIDVAPSLTELAGLEPAAGFQGESLLPLIREPHKGEDRESYFEAMAFNLVRNWAPLTGLYRHRYKFIDLPIPELYDLKEDPGETQNLTKADPRQARQMAKALDQYIAHHSTDDSRKIQTEEVDEETVARLRTLGYVVSTRTLKESAKYTEEDDPKRLLELSDMLDQGVTVYLSGRPEEAIRIFREILKRRPTMSKVYENLSYVLKETGRLGEAIEVLENALQQDLLTRAMLGRLGMYLQEAGRLEQSVALLEYAVKEDPTNAEALNYLAVSYARLGRTEEAVQTLQEVLELDPSYASAYSNLGSVHLEAERLSQAETSLRRAIEFDPHLARAWNGMGVVYAGTGRDDEAVSAWKRSAELDPRQYDTLFNLGTMLTRLNRFQEAIPYLEQFLRTAPTDRYGDDLPKVRRLLAELRRRV